MTANMIRQSFKGAECIGLQLWGLFMQPANTTFFFPPSEITKHASSKLKGTVLSTRYCHFFPLFKLAAMLLGVVVLSACCSEVEWDNVGKESILVCLFPKIKLQVLYYCVLVSASQLYQWTYAIGVLWKKSHTSTVVQLVKEEMC